MSMISTRTRRFKPTRRTARPAASFGAGLNFFVPLAVVAEGFVEPTDEDKAAVAQMFADGPEPEWDMAGEAAFVDAMSALTPPPADVCRSCGQAAEVDRDGLCFNCERDGTGASMACVNRHFGLGNRVF
jgi:hypothetical protein